MSNNVTQILSTSAFSNLKTVEETPISEISAEYGLLQGTFTLIDKDSSGTASVINSLYTCQTGVASDGGASITAQRKTNYRPGQGLIARLTAIFSPGVANNQQLVGLISAENSIGFGYLGTVFGIIRMHNGIAENQELTITVSAGGNENASITIDDIVYSVPITSGTVQLNAWEIAESLNSQVPQYNFASNNDQVICQALLAKPQGVFAFSSASAVAAFIQISEGLSTTKEIIPQADWNVDTRISADPNENLNPEMGNVYSIQFKYLGFGAIKYFIEDRLTGNQILVHVLDYANANTQPIVSNPSFNVGWFTVNDGNNTNIVISGASAASFIEGKNIFAARLHAVTADQTNIGGTLTNVIALRNRLNIVGKKNRADLIFRVVSVSSQTGKSAFISFFINPVFTDSLDFSYVDKENSIAETALEASEISGGQFIGGVTVTDGQSIVLQFSERNLLQPGQTLSIAAQMSGGGGSDVQAIFTWVEDL